MATETTQTCRDCGKRFPYDHEADYCPLCAAGNAGLLNPATVEQVRSLEALADSLCESIRTLSEQNAAMVELLKKECETRRAQTNALREDIEALTEWVRGELR